MNSSLVIRGIKCILIYGITLPQLRLYRGGNIFFIRKFNYFYALNFALTVRTLMKYEYLFLPSTIYHYLDQVFRNL